jgi:hypothetical protein
MSQTQAQKKAVQARFLLKVFIVRHVLGVGLFLFLSFTALQLKLFPLAAGAGALTLLYLGGAIWQGQRLARLGKPK